MEKQLSVVVASGVLALIIGFCGTAPVDQQVVEGPDLTSAYLEDDMLIDIARNGVLPNQTWPNGNVYYKITGNYNAAREQYIRDAMNTIESISCVRFWPAPINRKIFVRITAVASGCYASVGYNGKERTLNLQKHELDTGCFRRSTIVHELLHVLGFRHQHSAHDRDNYITINYENIVPGKEVFFQKFNETTETDFGFGYDYLSLLHYRKNAFSVNGEDTIVALDRNAVFGNRHNMSEKDIGKINAMYNCTGAGKRKPKEPSQIALVKSF